MGATPVVAAEELDPGRERRPLESYFQEIGGTRTLKREEEVVLAKDLEAATATLRDSLYAIPVSAKHVVSRWDALRALSHTGAKLSESVGDEETRSGRILFTTGFALTPKRTLIDDSFTSVDLRKARSTRWTISRIRRYFAERVRRNRWPLSARSVTSSSSSIGKGLHNTSRIPSRIALSTSSHVG